MALTISADARAAKLQTSYQNLSSASKTLNAASDKFSEAANALDEALNKLSPGVTAWVTINGWADDDAPWQRTEERLGFAKIHGRWGLSLCRVTMDGNTGEEETADSWLFNDGPRNLRLKAIEHVPELVESLAREAERTAKTVSEGANVALQLAHAINQAAVANKENRK